MIVYFSMETNLLHNVLFIHDDLMTIAYFCQTVEGQKRKLEEAEQQLNQRRFALQLLQKLSSVRMYSRLHLSPLTFFRDLMNKYKSCVEDLVKPNRQK